MEKCTLDLSMNVYLIINSWQQKTRTLKFNINQKKNIWIPVTSQERGVQVELICYPSKVPEKYKIQIHTNLYETESSVLCIYFVYTHLLTSVKTVNLSDPHCGHSRTLPGWQLTSPTAAQPQVRLGQVRLGQVGFELGYFGLFQLRTMTNEND